MPSPDHSQSTPVTPRSRTSIQVVSDRLAAAGLHRDQPIPTATEPEPGPIDVPRNNLASPDLVASAATPPDQPGPAGAVPMIESPGRLMGASEPDNAARDTGFADPTSDDQPETDKVPRIASVSGRAPSGLDLMTGPDSAESDTAAAGLTAEAPVVRSGLSAPTLDYGTASPGDPPTAQDGPRAAIDDDHAGFVSGAEERDGASMDLAKTNEILQQILEVLGKQQSTYSTSLPSASPAVYANRS